MYLLSPALLLDYSQLCLSGKSAIQISDCSNSVMMQQPALPPAFPVVKLSSVPPSPRSSKPSCTTIARLITLVSPPIQPDDLPSSHQIYPRHLQQCCLGPQHGDPLSLEIHDLIPWDYNDPQLRHISLKCLHSHECENHGVQELSQEFLRESQFLCHHGQGRSLQTPLRYPHPRKRSEHE